MRTKRVIAATVLAAIAATFSVIAAAPASALTSMESQFVSDHNNIRAQYGRPALTLESDLNAIARRHSQDMADQQNLYHNPNLGSQVQGWDVVGENVGEGPSVDDLMNAFMNSPEHRSNILDTDYNQFGVGAVVDSSGTIWVTIDFAHRGSTVRATTTSTRHVSTTTRTHSSSSSSGSSTSKPASKPASAPHIDALPPMRTVSMLEQLNAMD